MQVYIIKKNKSFERWWQTPMETIKYLISHLTPENIYSQKKTKEDKKKAYVNDFQT